MQAPPNKWTSKLRAALQTALSSGSSPEKIALGVALGVACGLFPVFGMTTALAFLVGVAFRVNPVLIQVFNYLMYPVYFPIAAGFIVAGAALFGGHGLADYSIAGMRAVFAAGWGAVASQLGVALLRAVLLWGLFAPVCVLSLRWLLLPWARRVAANLSKPAQSA
jgi:uncharacterized protein (DUF2062 family)